MATKRQLKKAIKRTCGYLAGECIISQQFIPGIDKEKLDDAIFEVADLQYDTVRAVSFSFDKTPKSFNSALEYNKARRSYFKKAYKNITDKFNEGIDKVVSIMNTALPASKNAE
ncbi:hypothetical protein [uncultured Muribaculum sp.]|uniref:hypothetical protein n=1 Tax=uncultured Muribaculum sp. TaxID=1918613 RepID=UPI00258CD59E|nr:hypothetical protein [uncultured Muribaculum sp.]